MSCCICLRGSPCDILGGGGGWGKKKNLALKIKKKNILTLNGMKKESLNWLVEHCYSRSGYCANF